MFKSYFSDEYHLAKEQIYSNSNITSLNLYNTFPSLYLRLDDFPKNYVKDVVLFCLPGKSLLKKKHIFKKY